MTSLKDIVFETDHYWVKRVPKGFEVYKTGLTHSTRVAVIGYTGDKGLQRAKLEIARREAASGPSESHHARKKKPSSPIVLPPNAVIDRYSPIKLVPRVKKTSAQQEPLGPPRSKAATVIVYSRPSGYWYAQAHDATTGARITDATSHSRDGVLRELRGKFAMLGVTIKSITDEDPYVAGHSSHHATKKSPAQLDAELDDWLRAQREKAAHERHKMKQRQLGGAEFRGGRPRTGGRGDI